MARLIRGDQVAKLLGLGSERAFRRWLETHADFPKPVSIGKAKNKPMHRWYLSDVEKWIYRLSAE